MRAANYSDHRTAYTPWGHTDMVRAALVEGIVPQLNKGMDPAQRQTAMKEAQRYRRLLKQYTNEALHERIKHSFDILQQPSLSKNQKEYVDGLTTMLRSHGVWKRMDHSHLEKEGVIIKYNASNLQDLVEFMYQGSEDKTVSETKVVVVGELPLDPDKDYLKHVPNHNRLLLNGKTVIRYFAESNGLTLPDTYIRNGNITKEVEGLLKDAGFTFNTSFEHAAEYMQEHPDRFISMFVIKMGPKYEVRFFPYELVAGHELSCEIDASNKRQITMRHGDPERGTPYQRMVFHVPRRDAFNGSQNDPEGRSKTHDEVELLYLPTGEAITGWLKTRVRCNCGSSLNLRDFKLASGGEVGIFDSHSRTALEYAKEHESQLSPNLGYAELLYPTPGFMRLVDRFRYNLSDGQSSVGTRNITFLVNEALKVKKPFSSKFTTEKPKKTDVLKPKYLVKQRNRLRK